MKYRIIDSYGTNQTAWTWAGALKWLRYCSPEAAITRFGRVIAVRAIHRI